MSEEEVKAQNAKKATQYTAEGSLSKAMQILVSRGLAQPTAATRDRMQVLHPTEPPPAARTTEEPQLRVTGEEVKKALMSMKSSAGPGPDSHRVSQYKAALGPAARARSEFCWRP